MWMERRKSKIFTERDFFFFVHYEKFRCASAWLLKVYADFLRKNALYEDKMPLQEKNFKIFQKNLEILFGECKIALSLVK